MVVRWPTSKVWNLVISKVFKATLVWTNSYMYGHVVEEVDMVVCGSVGQ